MNVYIYERIATEHIYIYIYECIYICVIYIYLINVASAIASNRTGNFIFRCQEV